MSSATDSEVLDKHKIRALLNEIGKELAAQGKTAEIALHGGASLVMIFENRPTTRDIDFELVRSEGCEEELVEIGDVVGARHGLPRGWFNTAVSQFKSENPEVEFFGDFPIGEAAGLRVFTASPRYMLAMKLYNVPLRSSLESHDIQDVWNLMLECGIDSVQEVESFIENFYPGEDMGDRNRAVVHDLLDDIANNRPYDPMNYWSSPF